MKNHRQVATCDVVDNRRNISNHPVSVPTGKLTAGSIDDKYPVLLDDGRTVIFIRDKSQERQIRLRYAVKKV